MKAFSVIFAIITFFIVCSNGAKQCYSCSNPCGGVVVEDCVSTLNVCVSMDGNLGGVVIKTKGCKPDTSLLRKNCATINAYGGNCYICSDDLCNGPW